MQLFIIDLFTYLFTCLPSDWFIYMLTARWSWLVPRLRGFWETVRTFIPRRRFSFLFFEVEISSCTLIPLFMPGSVHSGSPSWDDCGRMFPDKLRVSSFPDRLLHYAWTAAWSNYSDFVGSRACTCLGVTCHLHFWQNGRSLFTCHCGNTGVERTPKKESAQKVNPSEEKFPAAPAGIRTRNLFDHESGALANKLFRNCTFVLEMTDRLLEHTRQLYGLRVFHT